MDRPSTLTITGMTNMRVKLKKEPRLISRCTSESGKLCYFYQKRGCKSHPCYNPNVAYIEVKEFFELCFKEEKLKNEKLKEKIENTKTINKIKGLI